jgi:hypothetical protein
LANLLGKTRNMSKLISSRINICSPIWVGISLSRRQRDTWEGEKNKESLRETGSLPCA